MRRSLFVAVMAAAALIMAADARSEACPGVCVGDLNGDGTVDAGDLGILLAGWGTAGCGDLNLDGVVNAADLGILLGSWGNCPPGCGAPESGSCCSGRASPYCDDADCCTLVCAQDPLCCRVAWDQSCAAQAAQLCDIGCPCAHSICSTGSPLQPSCDPCVAAICAVDSVCCSALWDSICVSQVETVCARADCISPACAHPVCVEGAPLVAGCHPCVAAICAGDPFCCNTAWDALCIVAVANVCALQCP